jgi:serine/threonine-protein kinase
MRERIGRYAILEEVGRGAMGVVYKARDPQIDRSVAIKSILTANFSAEELERYKNRFYREAQAAGKMSHPGIITIHDIAEDENGQPYLVMEFVEGTTLSSLLAAPSAGMPAERLAFEQAVDIAIQVAQALDYAHRRGVVHRDIKPANILMTYDGKAKIADFGIAKLEGTQATQTGQMMGTPAFMSPEQICGSAVDARSDIFSLGAMLYWMLTGEKPFTGDTFTAISFKIVYQMPPPAKQVNPALPAAVDPILTRCLAKTPEERYNSAGELANELQALKEKKPAAAAPPPSRVEEPARVTPSPPVMKPAAQPAAKPAATPLPARVVSPAKPRLDPKLLAGISAAAVIVLLVVAYLLWPSKPAPPAPQGTEAVSLPEPAKTKPAASGPATPPTAAETPKAAGKSAAAPAAAGATTATLNIECTHTFRTAKLEIYSEGDLLTEASLRGSLRQVRDVDALVGTYRGSASISPGTRTLRVLVVSPLYNFEEEKEITGDFRAGASRTLVVTIASSGSERWLHLSWR